MRALGPLSVRAISVLVLMSLCSSDGEDVFPADDGQPFLPADTPAITFFPQTRMYPIYLADPRSPNFGILIADYSQSRVAAAGDSRLDLRMGGRFGIIRSAHSLASDQGWQVDLECGYIGQFDMDNQTDNIGYDGIYGLQFSRTFGQDLFLRLRTYHDSSHLGDEYIETTGFQRVGYTREEVRLGTAWRFGSGWLTYSEVGYAVLPRSHELVDPLALQGGIQQVRQPRWLRGMIGWYTALDLSAFEENNWDVNLTIQTGMHIPVSEASRLYRIGLEYYHGRVQTGELSRQIESRIALGFWVDI